VETPWSVTEARDRARTDGAHAVVDEFLDRLDSRSRPGVWISIVDEGTLRMRADALDAAGDRTLPLHGVPFAVKDNIDVAGVPTTAGAREFAYLPRVDAPAVARLIAAGAMFVGKTNLDQFATRLSGTCSPEFGICANPFDPEYIAGGSSSGSAVAVAVGLVPIALGTDTAGSGRVPAACCGIVGLKPTRELVDNDGLVPAAPAFDTVSVLAASARDARAAFDVLVESDRVATERPVTAPWRIGIPRTLAWFGDTDARDCYEAAITRIAGLGAELHGFDLSPFLEAGALLYGSALVGTRDTTFGAFSLTGADIAAVATPVHDAPDHQAPSVFAALDELARLHTATAGVWRHVDSIVVPTIARHPTIADALDHSMVTNRDLGTYPNFVNLLDLAAVAVPAGVRASALPFGVTIIGPACSDRSLLSLAAAFLGEPGGRRGIHIGSQARQYVSRDDETTTPRSLARSRRGE
jgi:allophanate hydrolase